MDSSDLYKNLWEEYKYQHDLIWQRVINSQGKVSLRQGEGGELQRALLEGEGVKFDSKDRVDLKVYLWEGPSQDWLIQNGL